MSIVDAIVSLVRAVEDENKFLAKDDGWGSRTPHVTVVRERAERELEAELQRFVDDRIAEKTGAC